MTDIGLWPAPSNPMAVARELIGDYQTEAGTLTLRRWRGTWMRWRDTRWAEVEDISIRKWVYNRLEHARYTAADGSAKDWAPNKVKVANILDALTAITHLAEDVDTPSWTGRDRPAPADEIVACTNGLLHVGTRQLIEHTPAYFSTVSVPFAYDPDAPEPARWLAFLKELWPEDPASAAALQEWFGYVLSGRTDLHKILLLVGPSRSGKGTIARVLSALIGKGNVTGPTLGALASNFGLWPLIGKPLAVIPDARVGGASPAAVIEKLLSISGEDMLTIDRKHREPWTGKLGTRLVMLSNELPQFGDASGAISSRFLVLMTTESFLGRENSKLTSELLTELSGILRWSLEGLDQLARRGALAEPKSSADARVALQDMVSPLSAFVRERCDRGGEVPVADLFAAWKAWCEENNHKPGTRQTFGRDLRAVVPLLRQTQPRDGETRERRYVGISLKSYTRNGEDRVPPRASEAPARDGTRSGPLQSQLCSAIGCENTGRLYPSGWRCDEHKPGGKDAGQ